MASKNGKPTAGQPRKIKSPKEFDAKVADYIETCAENGDPLTFGGLALHLGFCDRQSLRDYEKLAEFSFTVKKARLLVATEYEKRLSGNNVAGAIFALKNHGWSDRHDHTHGGGDKPIEVGVNELRTDLASRITGLATRTGTGAVLSGTNGAGT